MAHVEQRSLIFRIGGIGFLLGLQNIIEVLGNVAGALDFSKSDLRNSIIAALDFRRTHIPVFDPVGALKISSDVKLKDKVALVLRGSEGNWALVVDEIEELTGHENQLSCTIPDLLRPSAEGCYRQIRLINDEPYVVFDPENFYGAVVTAI